MERNVLVLEKRFDIVQFYREYGNLPDYEIHKIIRKLFLDQAIEILEKEVNVAEIYHILDKEAGEKIFRIRGCISFD